MLQPLIPAPKRRADGRGRPWKDTREVFNGVLWILRTGAPWQEMPDRYPPYQTCHRRFQQWVRTGVLLRFLHTLAEDLKARGGLDLSECFIDGTFVVAKKGASAWEKPSGAKVRSSWQWQPTLVFLSPLTWPALVRMKPSSPKTPVPRDSLRKNPVGSSGIKLTTASRSTRPLPRKVSS